MVLPFLFDGSSATVFLMAELPMLGLTLGVTVSSYLAACATLGSVGIATKVALGFGIRHGERIL
jgi:hypothetical protein